MEPLGKYRVNQAGRGYKVTIPQEIVKLWKLQNSQELFFYVSKGSLIIQPKSKVSDLSPTEKIDEIYKIVKQQFGVTSKKTRSTKPVNKFTNPIPQQTTSQIKPIQSTIKQPKTQSKPKFHNSIQKFIQGLNKNRKKAYIEYFEILIQEGYQTTDINIFTKRGLSRRSDIRGITNKLKHLGFISITEYESLIEITLNPEYRK